jgi:hypothetical protein
MDLGYHLEQIGGGDIAVAYEVSRGKSGPALGRITLAKWETGWRRANVEPVTESDRVELTEVADRTALGLSNGTIPPPQPTAITVDQLPKA